MEASLPISGVARAPAVASAPRTQAAAGLAAFSPNAPSVLVPLRFMVAGLLALVTGIVLVAIRPEVLATYHYNQFVIAITHLLVLGWICTVVMGAMYQLVPVALETRLHSERLARWQFVLHIAGFAGMVWMFWTWNMKQVGHYGTALAVGVGLFVYNIVRTLMKVPRWNVVASGVASAVAWLSLTVLAGLSIVAGKCTYESAVSNSGGTLGAILAGLKASARFTARFDQIGAMHAHAHLGVIGVFLMLIVGISYKLLPMFTLSEVQNPLRARASIWLLNAGLVAAFFAILLRSTLKPVAAGAAVTGLVLYGLEVRAMLAARKRRTLDWGIRYFLTALSLLAPVAGLGLVLSWPTLPLNGFTGQLENLYGFLALVGVISFGIIGMFYKIIPFLVWYRAYGREIGRARVPSLADLYTPALQTVGYWTWLAGLAVTGAGILLSHAMLVRCGALMLAGSLAALALNVVRMLSHLFRPQLAPLTPRPAPQTNL